MNRGYSFHVKTFVFLCTKNFFFVLSEYVHSSVYAIVLFVKCPNNDGIKANFSIGQRMNVNGGIAIEYESMLIRFAI